MSPEPDPGDLWRRVSSALAGGRGRVAILIGSLVVLLALYPDEVIRAAIGAWALLIITREINR